MTKRFYTVERNYLLPIYQHVNVEAETPEEAARLAVDLDDWESSEKDYDSSRGIYITGIWLGEDNDYGDQAFDVPADLNSPTEPQPDEIDALRLALEVAEEDLDHWERNGSDSAEEAESAREPRQVAGARSRLPRADKNVARSIGHSAAWVAEARRMLNANKGKRA